MQLCSNQDASFNFSHSTGFLHSRHAPQKEARRFAEELCIQINKEVSKSLSDKKENSLPNTSTTKSPLTVLIIGLGWGYLIEELSAIYSHPQLNTKTKQRDTTRALELFFYEPIPEVYQALKKQGRWEFLAGLVEELGAKLNRDIRVFRQELQKKGKTKILFHITPSYRRLFPQLLNEVSDSFKTEPSLSQMDRNTARHFLRQWTRNAFRLIASQNKLNFISGPSQEVELRHFSSKALFIYCGAGPSLIEDLKRISPEILAKAFIIASDTALGPLLATRCTVDLAICVDSGAASLHHLHAASRFSSPSLSLKKDSKIGLWDFPVLSWSGALPGLASYFSKVYYYRSTLPFDQILGTGPLAAVTEWQNTTRNPLGLALYMAYLLGAERLYSVGTSFRARKAQSHERATGYQEYVLGRANRIFNLEIYRTPAYEEEKGHSPKEHWAWQGALALASRLGLKLEKISDMDPKEIKTKLSPSRVPPKPIGWEKQLLLHRLKTSEICSFLASQGNKTALLSQLEELGLAAKLWRKYMQIL